MFNKVYLSRAQTRAMSIDYPIGDPFGGAAYGELRDPVTAAISAGGSILSGLVGGAANGELEGPGLHPMLDDPTAQVMVGDEAQRFEQRITLGMKAA